ncbi:MAG: RNA polymerase sigma factor [Otoolea sp.]|nr:RNA polymerase sigma factor [Clostridiaceae bacterium]MDD6072936.1 RNA polymerase sigma factor [Clostridium sp.]MDY5485062.1 RNA polymerase sigma factor [Clostridium sp.]
MFLMGIFAAMEEPAAYERMSDEKLLLLVAEGDREAFQRLYQNTDKTIYGFILSIVKNTADAEELMQETYLKIWTSAGSYHSQGKPLAWMFTIARNLCYMKFRDQKHEADVGLEDLSELETAEFCPQIEDAADKLVLQAALQILNEEERQIVLLRTAAGLKHREIAADLELPLATVLSKYNRAMKKLQKYLREEGDH